jgi:hypothetical protein
MRCRTQFTEHGAGDTFAFSQHGGQQMFGFNLLVIVL